MWTADHRVEAGKVLKAEADRRGKKPIDIAAQMGKSQRQVERAFAGDLSVDPSLIVTLARELDLDEDLVLPPRTPREKAQLDRIEAKLDRLLGKTYGDNHLSLRLEDLAAALDTAAPTEDLMSKVQSTLEGVAHQQRARIAELAEIRDKVAELEDVISNGYSYGDVRELVGVTRSISSSVVGLLEASGAHAVPAPDTRGEEGAKRESSPVPVRKTRRAGQRRA